MALSKETGCVVVAIGHVTKDGSIAGPRVLEHMVDVVLYFDSGEERGDRYRLLRNYKNRFGSTQEVGVFEMRDSGLTSVPEPSSVFLSGRIEGMPGTVVAAALKGSRSLLLEVQALAMPGRPEGPRRHHLLGLEYQRVLSVAAVLRRRAGLR